MKKREVKIELLNAVDAKVTHKGDFFPIWDSLSYPIELITSGEKTMGYKSFLHRGTGRFPAGLLPIVQQKLKRKGYEIRVNKAKAKTLKLNQDVQPLTVTLDKPQIDVLNKVAKHHRGIIVGPTGVGKTVLQAAIIAMYNLPRTLTVVTSRDLLYQTESEYKRLLSLSDVGLIGDQVRRIENITVAMYQTLVRYDLAKLSRLFDMVLLDEVHIGRSDSYQIIMNQLKSIHHRYGFTATMRLKQPDRYLTQGIVGKPIAILPEKKAKKRVTEVKMYMIRYHGEYEEYTSYQDRVAENVWLSEDRNSLLAQTMDFVVNKLGLNCLVLTEKYQHAKGIQTQAKMLGMDVPILWNQTSNKERERLKKRLNSKKLMCLIATPAIAVGSNIPNIEFVLIASETKHWLALTQRVGRGRRRTKTKDVLFAADLFTTFGNNEQTFKRQSFRKRRVYEHKGWLQSIVSFEQFKATMQQQVAILAGKTNDRSKNLPRNRKSIRNPVGKKQRVRRTKRANA